MYSKTFFTIVTEEEKNCKINFKNRFIIFIYSVSQNIFFISLKYTSADPLLNIGKAMKLFAKKLECIANMAKIRPKCFAKLMGQ